MDARGDAGRRRRSRRAGAGSDAGGERDAVGHRATRSRTGLRARGRHDDVAPLPKRRKISVGDRVSLTLDPLEGVVTKTGSGWYTVKFEFGGVDNFRADELRVL